MVYIMSLKSSKASIKMWIFFISRVKKVFVQALIGIQKLFELLPTLSLLPRTVLTQWGLWLHAVSYYKTFQLTENSFIFLKCRRYTCTAMVQECFAENNIQEKIQSIHNHFSKLPGIIYNTIESSK